VGRIVSLASRYGRYGYRRITALLRNVGVATLYIEPGSPWENGYVESYIGKLGDELLNCEVLDTLAEANVLVEGWRREYNRFRPHSSLGYGPPAPEAYVAGKFTQGLVLRSGGGSIY